MDTMTRSTMAPSIDLFGGEIGVRGEVFISLDKNEYCAGDTLSGHLTVVVTETMRCNALVFSLYGEEIAQWREKHDHHSRYQEFLREQILTATLPSPCEPGQYSHPFRFQLPANLPGVLDAHSLESGPRFTGLHATIKYTLKATVKVQGRFISDLEAVQDLIIRERTDQPVKFHAVERTVSKRLRWMRVLDRGTCHIAISMARDTFRLGENAQVECFVNNHTSSVNVQAVKCRLYQDVTLRHPQGGDRIASRPIMQLKYQGPTAGDLLERTLYLPMAMKIRFPTTSGSFLSCSYRISLECEYAKPTAPIKIDIPIIILPPQPATPSPRASHNSNSTTGQAAEEIRRTRAESASSSSSSAPSLSALQAPGPSENLMVSPMPARKSAFLSVSPRQSAASTARPSSHTRPSSHPRPSTNARSSSHTRQSSYARPSSSSTYRSRQISVSSMHPVQAPSTSRASPQHRLPPPPPPPATDAEAQARLIELLNRASDRDLGRQSTKSRDSLASSALMGLVQHGIVEKPSSMTRRSGITASPFTMSDNLSLSPMTLPRTMSSPKAMPNS